MEQKYLTVTALNRYIERKFTSDPYLEEIYIKGEISNFKIHNNNNIYFSIKDANTRIEAVYFGAKNLEFKDGDTVLIRSKINFYFPRGQHNLYVTEMKKDRIGELYQKFLELKAQLEKEGLFLEKYKKPIPHFSENIAVVTAKTGAAIQDIMRTIKRRYPIANIKIYSTLVQGENSVQDIVKNIKLADEDNNDVIILGRGGGSIEDLWSFNTEEVIRAIFAAKTPIITGIGHETDTTLADFVSDKRASTPTAAAEMATPNIVDIKNRINFNEDKIKNTMNYLLTTYRNRLKNSEQNPYFKNYSNVYTDYKKQLILLEKDLAKTLQTIIKDKKLELNTLSDKVETINPLGPFREKFAKEIDRLEANSPINILKKGYAITFREEEKINSINDIKENDDITVQFIDGSLKCTVNKITEEGVTND